MTDLKASINPIGQDRLLTVAEAAELTGLAIGTMYHLISERRVPVVRLSRRCVRFRLSDLHKWWDQLTVGSVSVDVPRKRSPN